MESAWAALSSPQLSSFSDICARLLCPAYLRLLADLGVDSVSLPFVGVPGVLGLFGDRGEFVSMKLKRGGILILNLDVSQRSSSACHLPLSLTQPWMYICSSPCSLVALFRIQAPRLGKSHPSRLVSMLSPRYPLRSLGNLHQEACSSFPLFSSAFQASAASWVTLVLSISLHHSGASAFCPSHQYQGARHEQSKPLCYAW